MVTATRVRHCTHRSGWTRTGRGEHRCDACGVRRFSDYGALRAPGLPHAVTPSGPARREADRRAALLVARAAAGGRRLRR
ncbi:DUF6255 family natural product biosynthesis protein [Streptomyces sp. NPDC046215]|uniref:Uncharacterized protein n=1 Tax=Streptomyces stramineus TaxID=173861 RepID=A0ABP3KYH6_9ACTN